MKRMAYPSSMPLVDLNQSIRLLAFGRLHCSLFFSFKPADQEDWSQTGVDECLCLLWCFLWSSVRGTKVEMYF